MAEWGGKLPLPTTFRTAVRRLSGHRWLEDFYSAYDRILPVTPVCGNGSASPSSAGEKMQRRRGSARVPALGAGIPLLLWLQRSWHASRLPREIRLLSRVFQLILWDRKERLQT